MKQVSILAAVLAVTLGLAGCSCHRAAYSAEAAPVKDNSAYQSNSGSNGKLGHAKRHCRHHCKKHCAKHKHTSDASPAQG